MNATEQFLLTSFLFSPLLPLCQTLPFSALSISRAALNSPFPLNVVRGRIQSGGPGVSPPGNFVF